METKGGSIDNGGRCANTRVADDFAVVDGVARLVVACSKLTHSSPQVRGAIRSFDVIENAPFRVSTKSFGSPSCMWQLPCSLYSSYGSERALVPFIVCLA